MERFKKIVKVLEVVGVVSAGLITIISQVESLIDKNESKANDYKGEQ